jgi:hypothetical protein
MKFSTPQVAAAANVNPTTLGKIIGDYSDSYGLDLDGKRARTGQARLACSFEDVARVLEFLDLTRNHTYSVEQAVAMVNDAFEILGEYIRKEAVRAYDKGEWPSGGIVLIPGEKPDEEDRGDEGPWLIYGRPSRETRNQPRLRDKPCVIRTRHDRDMAFKAGRLQSNFVRSIGQLTKRTDTALSQSGVLTLAE